MGPLAGVKVVEVAGIGPAPCAGMMLADLGAEVVLVERPNPVGLAAMARGEQRKQAFFNRGKKSVTLDLKHPEAAEVMLKLVESADVLIEGFRPGVMERLGLGPDVCLSRNPALVYGRMTGWGQTGPLAQAAGHDPNYIALSGALWHGGSMDRAPTAPLTLVGDLGGGTMVLVMGLLSAVIHASRTGQGQVVDCAITDGSAYLSSLLWIMRNTGQLHDELGKGWADFAAPWHDTYRCADGGFVTVCAIEPKFYAELMQRLGLVDEPAFANQWDVDRWSEAKAALQALFLTEPREHWCQLLEGTDACFAPVLSLGEAAQHPHNVERSTFIEVDGVVQPAPAPKFSVSQPQVRSVPQAGKDTDDVLRAAGLDDETIAALRANSVV